MTINAGGAFVGGMQEGLMDLKPTLVSCVGEGVVGSKPTVPENGSHSSSPKRNR